MSTVKQVQKGIINQYEVTNGSRMARISEDTEKTKCRVVVTLYVNHGQDGCRSKTFNTVKGGMKWAEGFLSLAK